jgi:hypothetical protein
MLRACCERVAKMLRMRLCVTSNIGTLSSPSPYIATMFRLYYDHVATCVACNIQYQEPSPPPPRHKPNITKSAIETQYTQH